MALAGPINRPRSLRNLAKIDSTGHARSPSGAMIHSDGTKTTKKASSLRIFQALTSRPKLVICLRRLFTSTRVSGELTDDEFVEQVYQTSWSGHRMLAGSPSGEARW